MRVLLCILTIVVSVCSYGQTFIEKQKVVASDRGFVDFFGSGGAISGDYAIVGAYREDEDENGLNTLSSAGSAYIFERDSSGVWHEVQKIVPGDRAKNAFFGWNVAIDSNIAIVGAFGDENDASGGPKLGRAGSAYIYVRDVNGIWQETQKINAADREFSDDFGVRVEICGTTILVGAQREDENENAVSPLTDAGSAYIFDRNSSGVWVQTQKIVASDRRAFDFFGTSISISESHIIVGAYRQDYDTVGSVKIDEAGAAYIFDKDSNGLWTEIAKITAPDREEEDRFGSSVFTYGDYVMVGANSEDHDENGNNFSSSAGSAYMYEKNIQGEWVFVKKLLAPIRNDFDRFGSSMSMQGDIAVISALYSDESGDSGALFDAGAVYIYKRDAVNGWNFAQKLNHSDIDADDQFGWKSVISGETIIITANEENDDENGQNPIAEAGSAYFFDLDKSCNTPNNLTSTSFFTTASLQWAAVNNASDYTLRGTRIGLDSSHYIYLNVNSPGFNASSLETGTSYYWQVKANCPLTASAFSDVDTFTTLEYICSTPQNLSVTNIGSNSAQLQWDDVPAAVNYVIRGSAGSYDKDNLVFVTSSNNSKFVSGLTPSTSYFWQVQSVCNNTPGPVSAFSPVNSFTTSASSKKSQDSYFSVLPNPSSGQIFVSANLKHPSSQLSIYDISGREIISEPLLTLFVDKKYTLEKGVYLIELVSVNDVYFQKVIIE